MRAPQEFFPGFKFSKKLSFGGSKSKGNPKTARVLTTKAAIHVVLRSPYAKGKYNLLCHAKKIESILTKQAAKAGVKLYDLANAGNHLHFTIRIHSRRAYRKFMRAISGLIARTVLGVERGRAWNRKESTPIEKVATKLGFWEARPFTRIVAWGKDYNGLKNYLMVNRLETTGMERLSVRDMLKEAHRLLASSKLQSLGFS